MANLETGSAQPSLEAVVDHLQRRGLKMSRAVRSIVIFLLVAVLTVSAPPLRAMAATLTVDDDGVQCPGAFPTISAAVLAANPLGGDVIVVCDGLYPEQVTIAKSLTLQGVAGQTPTVQAPAVMADPKAIIRVMGPVSVTIDGLVISGPGPSGCDSIRSGIRVDSGATALITDNLITDIRDTPFGGCQNGIGILVGRQSEGTTGMATINGNVLQGYQKGGIVVDNFGSSAVITNNVVTGVGRTEIIAQNGVQISRGAMVPPSNLQNNTITGNFYLNRSPSTTPAVATGILYFQAGDPGFEGPLNSGNKLRHNQVNVSIIP